MSTLQTTLIGREDAVAQAAALLGRDDVRLLTITGPGGIGKTRVAGAVASTMADRFEDGIVLVPLQSVRDPGLVVGTIARSVGLFDGEGDLQERLAAHLESRRLLLVVDNFEQVIGAASTLAAIVAGCPGLKVTVTSRARLRVAGEQELPLAPLARADAARLFVERARAVRPDYEPDESDLEAIAEICDQLDRLPLAIELAAARIKLLSPAAMVARLGRRLELLTSGPRDAPTRHRALRDTIGWSVDLLDEDERRLFRRLAVFAGGCTLEAVGEVCGGGLDTLGSLADNSLVRVDGERFAMLETIREHAGELLAATTEANEIRRAHAAHYLHRARLAAASMSGSDQVTWRSTIEADHDNIRAALRFSLDAEGAPAALELCAVLWRFWFERGYLSEGRAWLDESLAASTEPSPTRSRALSGNGVLAHYQGDYDHTEALCREALELSLSLEDAKGVAEAYTGLALVPRTRGAYAEAERLLYEALAVYEHLGADDGIARTLDRLAMNLVVGGEDERAHALFERSLVLFRRLGDAHGVAGALYGLSVTRPADGYETARAQADESLEILRRVGDRRTFGKVLWNLATIDADVGETATSAGQLAEAVTLFVEFGDRWFCGVVLESAAFLAAATSDLERAVKLFGAADAIWAALGVPLMTRFRQRHDAVTAEARTRLGESRFASAWEEGGRLPVGVVVELVAAVGARAETDAPDGLTPRELEVLAMVATGRTDAEVAEQLVVSLRTVHAHLRSIYRKLDLHTRSAATRYAIEHGLAA